MNLVDATSRLSRWRLRLAEYDFDVTYLKVIKNCLPDSISCIPSTGGTTVPIDEYIPCYSVLGLEDDALLTEENFGRH